MIGYSVGFNLYYQEVIYVIRIAAQPKSLFNQLQMVQVALSVDRRGMKNTTDLLGSISTESRRRYGIISRAHGFLLKVKTQHDSKKD
jgi:hypothetical protein